MYSKYQKKRVLTFLTMDFAVGIDIGGQTSKLGVVDRDGNVLNGTVIRSDTYGTDSNAFISALADAVKKCIADAGVSGKICGIGVGAPNGNYYTGQISNAPNLAWAAGQTVPIAGELSARLGGLPVTLTNDANAAAVGEMTYGVARGMRDFIMITLGTGVGSGIVIDGNVVYGHDGFAGELGHVNVVHHGGRLCGCGQHGCLETYCSATGVARTARERLAASVAPSLLRDVKDVTSKDVYEAARQGDRLAIDIFKYTGTVLGRALAGFVAFSAPEAIVLFGGLARAREFIYEPVVKSLNRYVMPVWKDKVKVLFSSLKESDAAILGASALAW